jgi:hypothetical protein
MPNVVCHESAVNAFTPIPAPLARDGGEYVPNNRSQKENSSP